MFICCLYAGVPEYQLSPYFCHAVPSPFLQLALGPYVSRTDWGWCMLREAYVSYPSEVLSVPGCFYSSVLFLSYLSEVVSGPAVSEHTSKLGR
jgi:hypothetical protein